MSGIKQFLWNCVKKIETRNPELLYLFLEVTRQCNLSCRHCGSDCKSYSSGSKISFKQQLALVDHCAKHFSKKMIVVLTGGEPLVYPELLPLISYIRNKGFFCGMVSNGFLLGPGKAKQLADSGLNCLTISLDGMQDSHNYLRGNTNAFERAVNALRYSVQSKIETLDCVTCVFPKNLQELDATASLLISIGVKHWRLFRIFPSGRAKNNTALHLNFDQTWQLLHWIADRRNGFKKQGLHLNYSCEGYLPFHEDKKVRPEPYYCQAGIHIAAVLEDGTITGCSNNAPEFFEGSILRDNLSDVWKHRFRKFRDRSWMQTGKCAACREFSNCQGNSIHLWDTDSASPSFCYVYRS